MKKILVLLTFSLFFWVANARPNMQKYCVCLKHNPSATTCAAVATEYTDGSNPCSLYDYWEIIGSTKVVFASCNATQVPAGAVCQNHSVPGSFTNIWDFVDESGQFFGIKGICESTGDTITVLDWTDSIPPNWVNFGTSIVVNNDGSITFLMYLADENNEVGLPD